MDSQLLECGHRQPVKVGAGATWCLICNEMGLVVASDGRYVAPGVPAMLHATGRPVVAGTRAAVASTRR
jgi:hypothetical protein